MNLFSKEGSFHIPKKYLFPLFGLAMVGTSTALALWKGPQLAYTDPSTDITNSNPKQVGLSVAGTCETPSGGVTVPGIRVTINNLKSVLGTDHEYAIEVGIKPPNPKEDTDYKLAARKKVTSDIIIENIHSGDRVFNSRGTIRFIEGNSVSVSVGYAPIGSQNLTETSIATAQTYISCI